MLPKKNQCSVKKKVVWGTLSRKKRNGMLAYKGRGIQLHFTGEERGEIMPDCVI